MLVENRSTNTGENVSFTRQLLAERGLDPQRFILVQKPYMERRTFATFKKVWPEPEIAVTSPQVTMDEYLRAYSNESLSPADVVSIMVGDLQRIRVYAERGFQIPQEIPDDVWSGFTSELRAAAGGYRTVRGWVADQRRLRTANPRHRPRPPSSESPNPRHQVVSTTLPMFCRLWMNRCASAAFSSGKVRATTG